MCSLRGLIILTLHVLRPFLPLALAQKAHVQCVLFNILLLFERREETFFLIVVLKSDSVGLGVRDVTVIASSMITSEASLLRSEQSERYGRCSRVVRYHWPSCSSRNSMSRASSVSVSGDASMFGPRRSLLKSFGFGQLGHTLQKMKANLRV